jgi:hypothetical protein
MTMTDAEKLAAIAERLDRFDNGESDSFDTDPGYFSMDLTKILES